MTLAQRYKLQKCKALKQFKNQCVVCGKKTIIIHHKNKNKKDNRLKNLMPICRSCHNKIHGFIYRKRARPIVNTILNEMILNKELIEVSGGKFQEEE